jgi:GT2 family glycosyltransferase
MTATPTAPPPSPLPAGTVAIIILNWNGQADTRACLHSLAQSDYRAHHIIVVDNGSSDDSVPALRRDFPAVTVLANEANLGFAAGNNVGLEHALGRGAEYVLLLNNDTVVDPRMLSELVAASQAHPEAGALGAKIYYHGDPQRLWYAGARWVAEEADFAHVGGGVVDDGQRWETIRETDYACGCALFTRAAVLRRVGLLHAAYFATWEEADWCYQARRLGHASLLAPQAKVWHKVSASFSGGWQQPHYQYYYWRNRLLWIERNHGRRETLRIWRHILWPRVMAEWRTYRDPSQPAPARQSARAGLHGVRDYLLRRFGRGPDWLFRATPAAA